jgi:L-Ala-D/L-Glu epimerase / N-acetyl-D-glutamate racemase
LIDALDDQRAAVSAIDCAIHDWIGRRTGLPTWRVLGLDRNDTAPTSMTIGLDDDGTIERKIDDASRFASLKIKVGTDHDVEIVESILAMAPDAKLRLDANAGWPLSDALKRVQELERFNPELIEQPIAAGHAKEMQAIHFGSSVPIFLDEDCVRVDDVIAFAHCATGVNIKLAKCGGISEAVRMIHVARAVGLRVMLGCMVETSLGIAGALQIASLADVVDLDGHLLLRDDPFSGLVLDGDRVLPTCDAGLGLDIQPWYDASL